MSNWKLLNISNPTPAVTIKPSELGFMSKETDIEIEKLMSVLEYLADREIVHITVNYDL